QLLWFIILKIGLLRKCSSKHDYYLCFWVPDMKFEDGIKRLEEIVGLLEEGNLGLDEALELFKEGIALTNELSKRLDEAEKKVELIVKRENGTVEKVPFVVEE
ncbi:MAG: exodeoxyribonuclease VII small subunit, partial [Deltaproteobacteria bacterium]|nr:exodeoxyribonuclease VII small subunit [Deltaproteobacteria bacterium]